MPAVAIRSDQLMCKTEAITAMITRANATAMRPPKEDKSSRKDFGVEDFMRVTHFLFCYFVVPATG